MVLFCCVVWVCCSVVVLLGCGVVLLCCWVIVLCCFVVLLCCCVVLLSYGGVELICFVQVGWRMFFVLRFPIYGLAPRDHDARGR